MKEEGDTVISFSEEGEELETLPLLLMKVAVFLRRSDIYTAKSRP